MITLADSHVHLDRYPTAEVTRMLQRALRVGVRRFLTVGVDLATSQAAAELAERRPVVDAAIGVHPTRAGGLDLDATLAWMRPLLVRPEVVAIGEVGLDDTATTPLHEQAAYFEACLGLAVELDLPLSLHVVGAHPRAQAMLAERPVRAIVHYFQGDRARAEAYLRLGCSISVGRPATRPERLALREAIRHIPLERLLLETDTYPLPGRTTEPRDVAEICRSVAESQGVAVEEVARTTTENYRRLFGG